MAKHGIKKNIKWRFDCFLSGHPTIPGGDRLIKFGFISRYKDRECIARLSNSFLNYFLWYAFLISSFRPFNIYLEEILNFLLNKYIDRQFTFL